MPASTNNAAAIVALCNQRQQLSNRIAIRLFKNQQPTWQYLASRYTIALSLIAQLFWLDSTMSIGVKIVTGSIAGGICVGVLSWCVWIHLERRRLTMNWEQLEGLSYQLESQQVADQDTMKAALEVGALRENDAVQLADYIMQTVSSCTLRLAWGAIRQHNTSFEQRCETIARHGEMLEWYARGEHRGLLRALDRCSGTIWNIFGIPSVGQLETIRRLCETTPGFEALLVDLVAANSSVGRTIDVLTQAAELALN